MTQNPFIPVYATWAVSFLCYGLAGVLIWKRKIGRTPHILLTVAGFMADFVALFFQGEGLAILLHQHPDFALDQSLKGLHTTFLNLSMAMYCVTALFGFSRIVGWWKIGRWHVHVALTFLLTLLTARLLYLRLIT